MFDHYHDPPKLAPGECIIEDLGNQFLVGPCTAEPTAAAVVSGGGGLGLLFTLAMAGAGVWLHTEVDRRQQLYRAFIQSLEGELNRADL
jgi:hypothetical protein